MLSPDARLDDSDDIEYADGGAKQRDRVLFTNAAGTMSVGLWDTAPMLSEPFPFPYHEFSQACVRRLNQLHSQMSQRVRNS